MIAIDLATPDDEPQLRRLMREVTMPGFIEVAFCREPDFFAAAAIEGDEVDILVARAEGRVVGVASHARRSCFVDGEPRPLGYLSMLRVHPDFRRQGATRAGWERVRAIMEARGEPWCISTVIKDNDLARAVLEARHEGFPTFHPVEDVVTLAIPPRRVKASVPVRAATAADLPGIVRCLRRFGARRQFAVAWTEADLLDPARARGLRVEDFFVWEDGGEVRGCAALWDQSAFKQTIVVRYGAGFGRVLRAYNLVAPLAGQPRLPPQGTAIPSAYVSHLAVDDDALEPTLALVGAACARASTLSYVLLGLSARDPRLDALRRAFSPRLYVSTLHTVSFGPPPPRSERLAHVEVATL